MLRYGLAGILLLLFSGAVWALNIGSKAPDFRLNSASGKPLSLSQYEGQVVLVNFWASWCAPCRKELPALEKIYRQHKNQGFTIIGINIDKEKRNADRFIKEFGVSFPLGYDPDSKVIARYKGQAMPTSYLIDRRGKVQKIFLGFNNSKLPKMRDAIVTAIRK